MREFKVKAWNGKEMYIPILCNGKVYRDDRDYEDGISTNDPVIQFAGLHDKNGKEIFEGDILKTSNSNSIIWYVDYKPTAFMANQANVSYDCVLSDFMATDTVEVIGNIYQNPELLKKRVS
jgi:uncharacterized phage protein (TIGR01671 family)